MEELVKTFYIDWKLLVAQLINFFIVLGVLWKFALRPLRQTMDKRSAEIAKSLAQAKEIEKKLSQTESDYESKILQAKKESQAIIVEATTSAENQRQALLAQTKAEANKIVEQAKQQIVEEKKRLQIDLKKETASLVIAMTKKILEHFTNEKFNDAAIKKVINDFNYEDKT